MSLLLLFNGIIPENKPAEDEVILRVEETRAETIAHITAEDNLITSCGETTQGLSATLSTTDAVNVSPEIDTATLTAYILLVDTLLATLSETGKKHFGAGDEVLTTISEDTWLVKQIAAGEIVPISIAESVAGLGATVPVSDSPAITLSEIARFPYKPLLSSDSLTISPLVDIEEIKADYSSTDEVLVRADITGKINAICNREDTLLLAPAVDALEIVADVTSLDTVRVTVTDTGRTPYKSIKGRDTISVTATQSIKTREGQIHKADQIKITTGRIIRLTSYRVGVETFPLLFSEDTIPGSQHDRSDNLTLIPDCDEVIVCEPRKRASDVFPVTADGTIGINSHAVGTDTLIISGPCETNKLRNVHTICADSVRRIHSRVIITYTNPLLDSDLTLSASEDGARNTYILQTADNIETPPYKYAGCAFTILDGTFHPVPSQSKGSVGWWSDSFSDANGNFATPLQLIAEFSRDTPLHELKVVGDSKLGEYPVDFDIEIWVDDGNGGLKLYEEYWNPVEVRNNTDVYWYQSIGTTPAPGTYQGMMGGIDARKIVLKIYRWNKPNSQAKITEFYSCYREIYEDEDLFYVSVLEEIDSETGTLPYGNISANECVIRLNNADRRFDPGNINSPLYGLLRKNRKIEVFFGVEVIPGTIEWYPRGVFWSQDWKAPEREIYAEVTGLDRLEFLRHTTFNVSTVYENQSVGDVCEVILAHGGVQDGEYIIDPSLYTVTIPYIWFDSVTHRYALKRLAEAALGRVYCDVNGKIRIEPYTVPETRKLVITPDNFFEKDHPLAWTDIVNYVEVHATPYTPGSRQVIYQADLDLDVPYYGTVTKFFIYEENPCVDIETPTFTGDTSNLDVISWHPYSWGAEVVLRAKTNDPCHLTGVTIYGKPLTEKAGIAAIKKDQESINVNGLQSLSEPYESPFIQTEAQADEIATILLASGKDPRRDIKLNCRGDLALYLGERIAAPEYKNSHYSDYVVVRQEFSWNGGLTCELTARKVITEG